MKLNPFSSVKNYSEMLDKIAWFNLFICIFLLWIIRINNKAVDDFFLNYALPVNIGWVKLSIGYIWPCLIIAVISRIIKLHDRISDLFLIRNDYDKYKIIVPLIAGSGAIFSFQKINNNYKRLMKDIFYKYVSTGSNAQPSIDMHIIERTLDQLSWYWIIIEAIVLFCAAAIISLVFNIYILTISLLFVTILLILFSRILSHLSYRYTQDEIEEILNSDARKSEIRNTVNAIQN